jgi:nitroreductase/dihydropteridine reductase
MSNYLNNLKTRYATKRFDSSKKLTEEQLELLISAMHLAPSSYGLQPYLEIWAKNQAYIVLGFLLDAAAQNNIDSCPMEGFDSDKYDEILNLKEKNLKSVVVCPVGFRSNEDLYANLPKVRVSKADFVIEVK